MRRFLLAVALLIMPGEALGQSNFTRVNSPGPHAVGFRIIEQYDQSRGYRGASDPYTGKATSGERARPIQTLIWYPSEKGTGSATSAGDYLRLGGTIDRFPTTLAERARLETGFINGWISGLTS